MQNRYKYKDFDPRSWTIEKDDDVCYLNLSNRIDCYCKLDRIDYEWAKRWLWCHTYGSGTMNLDTWTIDRPDAIYARRSIPIEGFLSSGRQRYGNEFLHLSILNRICPRPVWATCGDHIDGDSLNNRRRNLRWATTTMNNKNRKGTAYREQLLREYAAQVDSTVDFVHDRLEISKVVSYG